MEQKKPEQLKKDQAGMTGTCSTGGSMNKTGSCGSSADKKMDHTGSCSSGKSDKGSCH